MRGAGLWGGWLVEWRGENAEGVRENEGRASPHFPGWGTAGSAFHSGDGDWKGLVWLGNFLGSVSVCCGLAGWFSAVFKGSDEFNNEDDGGAQEDKEVAQVEYYFFELSVLDAEVIYYVAADQSVVEVAGGAA